MGSIGICKCKKCGRKYKKELFLNTTLNEKIGPCPCGGVLEVLAIATDELLLNKNCIDY